MIKNKKGLRKPQIHLTNSDELKVSKKTESSKRRFCPLNGQIPCRPTRRWVTDKEINLKSRKDLELIALGKAPLGILPTGAILPSESYRLAALEKLNSISAKKYDNTSQLQRVECYGDAFVDSRSLNEHFKKCSDTIVGEISDPLLQKTRQYLESLGFVVDNLIDPLTGCAYPAGILRKINVNGKNSVCHIDDYVRDGQMKPDFRLPTILKNQLYYQISFNILLDDGGYQADPLYTFNRFYHPCDEKYCLPNGWQFETEVVNDVLVHKYQPKVAEAYVFSTSAYHDIYGGSPLANRVTWSVFAIYVPALNLMIPYN